MLENRDAHVAELVDALVSGFDFVVLQGGAGFGNSLFLCGFFRGAACCCHVFHLPVLLVYACFGQRVGTGVGTGVKAEMLKI